MGNEIIMFIEKYMIFFTSHLHISRVMRKPAFCLCENKGADQLRSMISAFVFATQIVKSSTSQNRNFKALAIFCGCTAQFVSHHVGNPEGRFSHAAAHIIPRTCLCSEDPSNPTLSIIRLGSIIFLISGINH